MMGAMVKPMLLPLTAAMPIKLPACGEKPVDVTVMGKTATMTPSPCGEYTLNVEMPATPVSLPDISGMTFAKLGLPAIPMMPARLADLPSFTMTMSADVFHQDGSQIFGIE